MTARNVLVGTWLVLGAVPLVWWLLTRRAVDVWRHLPVPAALVDGNGAVRRTTGPAAQDPLDIDTGLPAPGRVARSRSAAGTPVAVTGLRRGGLVVALPTDAVLERRDRLLAELGSRLAHDINTPLSVLHGHLDLILNEDIGEISRDSARTCQRELIRLQTTAKDLLTLTRLRAGGTTRTPQLAGALAEEAAAGVLDLAETKDATLTVEVPSERVLVDVAEADLVRALRNLLVNALTHGLGEDRRVHLDVDASTDDVTFAVIDSGPGIAPADLDRLTEPLVRAGGTETPGSGLGLAIVVEVLVGHGASLTTGRTSENRPMLTFTLPRVR